VKGYTKITAALAAFVLLFIAIGVSTTGTVSAQAASITVVPSTGTTVTADGKKNNTVCSVATTTGCVAGDGTYVITVNDQGRTSDDTRMETITVTVKNGDLATVTPAYAADGNAKTITLVETDIATDIFTRTVTTKHASTGLQGDFPVAEVTTATSTTEFIVLGWDDTAGNDSIDGNDPIFTNAMRAVIVAAGVAQPVNVITHADNKELADSRDITGITSAGVVTIATMASITSVGDRFFVPGVAVESKAFSGNTLTVTYKPTGTLGISKSITVDNVKSSLVSNSPAVDLITKSAKTVNFNADITDTGAGYPTKSSNVVLNNTAGTKGRIQLFVGSVASGAVTLPSSAYSAITNGYNLNVNFSSTDIANIGPRVPFWIEAEDLAGNVKKATAGYKGNATATTDNVSIIDSSLIGMGDSMLNGHSVSVYCSGVKSTQAVTAFASSTGDMTFGVAFGCVPAANQEYEIVGVGLITVDSVAPTVSSAAAVQTGHNWSSTKAAGSRIRSGLSDKDTSIRVTFTDASGLMASTVTPASFNVAGNTVTSTLLVDVVGENAAAPVQRTPNDVFLTLGTALASSGRPNVSIIGGIITDKAGNAVVSGTYKATDKLGPGLATSKSANFSKKEIKVTIVADEQLLAAPVAKVNQLTSASVSTTLGGDIASTTMAQTGALTYVHTTKIAQAPGAIGSELMMYYTASDTSSNTAKAGHATDGANPAAIIVEFDEALNGGSNPKVSVSDKVAEVTSGNVVTTGAISSSNVGPSIEAVDPLIVTIDFNKRCKVVACTATAEYDALGESKEYARDSYKTVTLTKATMKVTFSDGTFETTTFDVATDITSPDSKRFTIPVSAPKVGQYELSIQAVDLAGNNNLSAPTAVAAQTLKYDWKVTAALPVKLALSPGWNLISLPFQPANPAVNSVIGATHPADIVMTFDNANQVWLVSRRDADSGLFTGDVAVMTSNTAYFVRTNNFQELSLLRPPVATAAAAPPPPPAISVVPGWNLVPVVSLTIPLPVGIAADSYFGTLQAGVNRGWLKAMTFSPLTRTWTSVSPLGKATYVVGATNPCTGVALNATNVANQTEPCQNAAYTIVTANGGFDGSDTVALKTPVLVGKGYWLYATAAGVIIP